MTGRGWPPVSVTVLAHRSVGTSVASIRSVLDDGYPGTVQVLVREQGGDVTERELLVALAADHPRVDVEHGPNLGFCGGHDRLLSRADGEILVLLNADAVLRPGFLEAVVPAFDDPSVGSVQPLVLDAGDNLVVDTAGLDLHRSRRVSSRFRGRPSGEVEPGEIWGADGAVLVLRRRAYTDALDPQGRLLPVEFGSYKEDVELAWRLRRLGWRCVLVTDAVAEHARGTSAPPTGVLSELRDRRARSPVAHVNGFANMRLTRLRHEDRRRLLGDLHRWLPAEIAAWLSLAVTPSAVLPVLRQLRRGFGPSLRARRRLVPRWRVVDDRRWMETADRRRQFAPARRR